MNNKIDGMSRSRRKLLKALAGGGAAATLPEGWIRPVVDSVLLPAHAVTTECRIYGVSGFVAAGFDSIESAVICVEVCGDIAFATFQTDFDGEAFIRRTGTFVNGEGTMAITDAGQGCFGNPARSASISNVTSSSLTFTMQRGQNAPGPIVATLFEMSSCPTFPPVTGDCL